MAENKCRHEACRCTGGNGQPDGCCSSACRAHASATAASPERAGGDAVPTPSVLSSPNATTAQIVAVSVLALLTLAAGLLLAALFGDLTMTNPMTRHGHDAAAFSERGLTNSLS